MSGYVGHHEDYRVGSDIISVAAYGVTMEIKLRRVKTTEVVVKTLE